VSPKCRSRENFYETHGFASQKVDILFKEVLVSKLERKENAVYFSVEERKA
jgi:hypothetical protein